MKKVLLTQLMLAGSLASSGLAAAAEEPKAAAAAIRSKCSR